VDKYNKMEEIYLCLNFLFVFVFGTYLIHCLIRLGDNRKNDWRTLLNVNIMRSGSYGYRHIFVVNGEDGCLDNVGSIRSLVDVGKRFYLSDELDKMDYVKFDIKKINRAHRNICEKIMEEEGNCIIMQNMSKPRDLYDLYCCLLMSKRRENVMVHIENYRRGLRYIGGEYGIRSVISDGGHMRYLKGGRRREVNLREMEVGGVLVYYMGEDGVMELMDNVVGDNFEVNIYGIEGRSDYGVGVLRNDFGIDDKELYFIGQYYKK